MNGNFTYRTNAYTVPVLPGLYSLFPGWNKTRRTVFMRNHDSRAETFTQKVQGLLCPGARFLLIAFGMVFAGSNGAQAYTVVTSTSPALEKTFLAATTMQFPASQLIANPLASNTYQLKLLGPGVAIGSSGFPIDGCGYVYGFAAGQQYERNHDINLINSHHFDCGDNAACLSAINSAVVDIYTQNYSTPTVIPGF